MNDSFLLIFLLIILGGCGCNNGLGFNGFGDARGLSGGCGDNVLLILLLLCVFRTCNCNGNGTQTFDNCNCNCI